MITIFPTLVLTHTGIANLTNTLYARLYSFQHSEYRWEPAMIGDPEQPDTTYQGMLLLSNKDENFKLIILPKDKSILIILLNSSAALQEVQEEVENVLEFPYSKLVTITPSTGAVVKHLYSIDPSALMSSIAEVITTLESYAKEFTVYCEDNKNEWALVERQSHFFSESMTKKSMELFTSGIPYEDFYEALAPDVHSALPEATEEEIKFFLQGLWTTLKETIGGISL